MSPVNPTKAQFDAFINAPDAGPMVMVNLLKFKETVDDGSMSGRQSYRRYSENVFPLLKEVGAKVVWAGNVNHVFIGTNSDEWDYVLLVEYPSKAAFIKMISSESYMKVQQDRENALERAALINCAPNLMP